MAELDAWISQELGIILKEWGLAGQPALLREVFDDQGAPNGWARPSLERALEIRPYPALFANSGQEYWDIGRAVFSSARSRAEDRERADFARLEAEQRVVTARYIAEAKSESPIEFASLKVMQIYQALYGSWLSSVIGEPPWVAKERAAALKARTAERDKIAAYNAAEVERLRSLYGARDASTGSFALSTFENLSKAVAAAVAPAPAPAVPAPVAIDVSADVLAGVRSGQARAAEREQLRRDEDEAARLRALAAQKRASAELEDPARPAPSKLAAAFKYLMALLHAGPGGL